MKIIKVKKDTNDVITDVMLDDNRIININEAINLAMNKQIDNVTIGHSKNGKQYLRSYPNGDSNDNLDRLPLFK